MSDRTKLLTMVMEYLETAPPDTEMEARAAIDAVADWFDELLETMGVMPSAIPALLRWQANQHEYLGEDTAARYGADQELEACCQWLVNEGHEYEHVALRDARRPRLLSLREEALETLRSMQIEPCWINGINTNAELMSKYDILRRALEFLPD